MLKLEFDKSDHVIRSIGDAPHGIVATADVGEELKFGVVASWDPARENVPTAPGMITRVSLPGEPPDDFAVVDVHDLIDACPSINEVQGIWFMAASNLAERATTAVANLDLEAVTRALAAATIVRDEFESRGWLKHHTPGSE